MKNKTNARTLKNRCQYWAVNENVRENSSLSMEIEHSTNVIISDFDNIELNHVYFQQVVTTCHTSSAVDDLFSLEVVIKIGHRNLVIWHQLRLSLESRERQCLHQLPSVDSIRETTEDIRLCNLFTKISSKQYRPVGMVVVVIWLIIFQYWCNELKIRSYISTNSIVY